MSGASDCCADCGVRVVVGVVFEVIVPRDESRGGNRVVSWRLCRRCLIAARAAEAVANG